MNTICLLENPIQEYAWGSKTAIPNLLGKIPTETPQAELWMGAHPKSPSLVRCGEGLVPLPELIAESPAEILGRPVADMFNGELPYLLKVLAADQPLSVQAHPNARQAAAGYEGENQRGIALSAPDRNYRDPNHKPECICALTPFWGLNGFRKISEMILHLERICPVTLARELAALKQSGDDEGLRRFFRILMTLSRDQKQRVITEAVSNAERAAGQAPDYQWVTTLHKTYPADIGILSPLILNLVCLQPGEAMFLEAGELHAYLSGVGIELMANSDNVLRGGLTPKHVDVPELLNVLNFREKEVRVLLPKPIGPCEAIYECDAREFALSVITVTEEICYASEKERSVEILLCTAGRAFVTGGDGNVARELVHGTSVLVPASVPVYRICGEATIYKAAVPSVDP